jgi:hypothetical protein
MDTGNNRSLNDSRLPSVPPPRNTLMPGGGLFPLSRVWRPQPATTR